MHRPKRLSCRKLGSKHMKNNRYNIQLLIVDHLLCPISEDGDEIRIKRGDRIFHFLHSQLAKYLDVN